MTIYTSEKVMPYVYMGIHKETGEFYIGSRWANKTPSTSDLGVFYFTSSTKIKPRFAEFDWQVVAEFFDKDDAFAYEQSLIQQHWCNERMLNSMFSLNGKPGYSGMTGKQHSTETRMLMSWRALGLDDKVAEYKAAKLAEHYKRRSEAMKTANPGFKGGNTPWNAGKHVWVGKEHILAEGARKRAEKRKDNPYTHTEESLAKIKDIAKNRPLYECPHCKRLFHACNLKRYHGDKCKLKPV